MTGRRLYEIFCDGWSMTGDYWRNPEREGNLLHLPKNPPAWPFLSDGERRAFNHAASRMKGVKR